MTALSGTIEANSGPLSAAFQQRVKYALYLIIASAVFGFFASKANYTLFFNDFLILMFYLHVTCIVVIGLPTIVLRPSKFVMCMTLSTSFAAASVIVMQTPSVFLANLVSAGFEKSGKPYPTLHVVLIIGVYIFSSPAPFAALVATMLSTFFVTIFFNRYLFILCAASCQVACLLWYLSTYIPGGPTGLKMLMKAAYMLVSTAMAPCLFVTKKMLRLCLSRIFS